MNWISNFFGHLGTILHHKKLVRHYCFKAGLYKQGITHDWSKYHPVEFWNGVRYYQGGKRSPNFGEKQGHGYSSAWLHHKGRNRIAASKNYNRETYDDGFALAYYEKNREHYVLHPETQKLLELLLHMLAKEGEEKTFAYIRQEIDWKHSRKW